jgi:sugar/nucleoside kinase (ribokinase family)
VIILSPSGERSVIFVNGANALLNLEAVPGTRLDGKCVVLVGSILALPQFTGEAVGVYVSGPKRMVVLATWIICSD